MRILLYREDGFFFSLITRTEFFGKDSVDGNAIDRRHSVFLCVSSLERISRDASP